MPEAGRKNNQVYRQAHLISGYCTRILLGFTLLNSDHNRFHHFIIAHIVIYLQWFFNFTDSVVPFFLNFNPFLSNAMLNPLTTMGYHNGLGLFDQ